MEKTYKFSTKDRGIFFTSDTHFGHDAIRKYCKRPFQSTEEMNEKLIENWNSVVSPGDIVFHLGDFAFGGPKFWSETIDRLSGEIWLILGNHDLKSLGQGYMEKFKWVGHQARIKVDDKRIILNHLPFLCFDGSWKGMDAGWNLFGHVHSGPYSTGTGFDHQRLGMLFPSQYDVGVDNNDFTPVSFQKVSEIINEQLLSLNMYRG